MRWKVAGPCGQCMYACACAEWRVTYAALHGAYSMQCLVCSSGLVSSEAPLDRSKALLPSPPSMQATSDTSPSPGTRVPGALAGTNPV